MTLALEHKDSHLDGTRGSSRFEQTVVDNSGFANKKGK